MATSSLTFLHLSEQQRLSIMGTPPALSALQSFETFLFLTALGRHPQAMVFLASGIESAAKSILGQGPTDRSDLAKLSMELNSLVPQGESLRLTDTLEDFRNKRNNIVHFGCSPGDDDISIRLSFGTAVPLLNMWLGVKHGVSIFASLPEEFAYILKIAVDLIQDQRHKKFDREQLIRGVQRWIIYKTRESYLTNWELFVLNSDMSTVGTNIESGFDFRDRVREKLVHRDDREEFDCPICKNEESFLVSIDYEALSEPNPKIVPLDGICVWCDFHISSESEESSRFLSHHCQDQFTDEVLKRIRKEYGLSK